MSYAITFDHFQRGSGVIKMSNEQNFDTLKYANRLKAVGVPEKQAEVQAEIMAETINNNLATKRDIKELELKIDLKIESSKDTTIRWLGSMIAIGVTTTITVLGFLIRLH
ncbi:MAG: hypothetical protein WCH10_05790 [bacterium]